MNTTSKPAAATVMLAVLLTAFAGGAVAQDSFQLPRECSERHNVDPAKCVIQDGPAPLPWVHAVPLNDRFKTQGTGATPPATPAAPVTPAGQMPARKAGR